jgi:hypothetical protein
MGSPKHRRPMASSAAQAGLQEEGVAVNLAA